MREQLKQTVETTVAKMLKADLDYTTGGVWSTFSLKDEEDYYTGQTGITDEDYYFEVDISAVDKLHVTFYPYLNGKLKGIHAELESVDVTLSYGHEVSVTLSYCGPEDQVKMTALHDAYRALVDIPKFHS